MCQDNIPDAIASPPATWTGHEAGWVHGFMLLMPNSEHTINVPQQKSRFNRPGYVFTVFNCLVLWACAHCSLRFLLLDDRSGTWVVPAVVAHPARDLTCVLRCCKERLSKLPSHSCQPIVCPFSSDLIKKCSCLDTAAHWIFFCLSHHSE